MKTKRSEDIAKKSIFILLCIMLADAILFTGATLISIGPLNQRMIFAIPCGGFALIYMIKDWKRITKNPFAIAIVALAFILGMNTIRAIVLQQDMSIVLEKLKGFFFVYLFFVMLYCIQSQKQIEILFKVLISFATVLSVSNILISLIAVYANDWMTPIYNFCMENTIGMLYMVTEKIPRLLFHGVVSQIIACCVCCYFYIMQSKKKNIYAGLAAVNLVGILQTYTRSIYLGAFIAAAALILLFLFVSRYIRKQIIGFCAKSIGVFAVIVIVLHFVTATSFFEYGFLRLTMGTPLQSFGEKMYSVSEKQLESLKQKGSLEKPGGSTTNNNTPNNNTANANISEAILEDVEENKISDELRKQMTSLLKEKISGSPLFGQGLGDAIDLRDGRVEMAIYDLLSKIGIVGVFVFLFPVTIMLITIIKAIVYARKRQEETMNPATVAGAVLVCGFLGVLVASYYNPFILGPLTLFIYSLAMRLFSTDDYKLQEDV